MINPKFININVDYIMKLLFKQDIRKATDLSKPQSIIAMIINTLHLYFT